MSKLTGGKNEKSRWGFLNWKTLSINGFAIQILLPQSKEERIKVISRLSSTCVTHKLQEHLSFSLHFLNFFNTLSKQPPIGVLMKRCSGNMHQICRSAPMPKLHFAYWNCTAKQLCWNCTFPWVFFCKFAAYFQNTFS